MKRIEKLDKRLRELLEDWNDDRPEVNIIHDRNISLDLRLKINQAFIDYLDVDRVEWYNLPSFMYNGDAYVLRTYLIRGKDESDPKIYKLFKDIEEREDSEKIFVIRSIRFTEKLFNKNDENLQLSGSGDVKGKIFKYFSPEFKNERYLEMRWVDGVDREKLIKIFSRMISAHWEVGKYEGKRNILIQGGIISHKYEQ